MPVYVLGQPNLTRGQPGISQAAMNAPSGVAYDDGKLFVSDTQNNRVLVYNFNVVTISSGMNATDVLGQANFSVGDGSTTQSGLRQPTGLVVDGSNKRLFVSDSSNNRVLVFDITTIMSGMPAQNVLGQSDFITGASAVTQSKLNNPRALSYDDSGKRLFVADTNNNRVLVFDVTLILDGEDAVSVLGQTSFTSSAQSASASRMNMPVALVYDPVTKRLFVADGGNNRVIIFDVTTITNGESAVNVLGQPILSVSTPNTSQPGLWNPQGLGYDSANKLLLVAEANNNRLTVFDLQTLSNGENAADMIGQYNSPSSTATINYTKSGAYTQGNNTPTELSLSTPSGTAIDTVHHRLFVADYNSSRVLVYNLDVSNILLDHTADYVLGQSNFYSTAQVTTQSSLWNPVGLAYDASNNRLFVADQSNNRVLIYNTASIVNGQTAFKVLGQADFVSNSPGITASTMTSPGGLAYDPTGNRLFVSETLGNHRVLVFDLATITNGEDATNVLGQVDFTSNVSGLTSSQMSYPGGLAYDDTNSRLFVADNDNNRVLIFNVTTLGNGQSASRVLGQPGFGTGVPGTTQALMDHPWGVSYDGNNNRLFVSDVGNNRVLVFDTTNISNGQNARSVFGQPDFISKQPGVNPAAMSMPWGISYAGNRLYVADSNSNRVLIFDTWGF